MSVEVFIVGLIEKENTGKELQYILYNNETGKASLISVENLVNMLQSNNEARQQLKNVQLITSTTNSNRKSYIRGLYHSIFDLPAFNEYGVSKRNQKLVAIKEYNLPNSVNYDFVHFREVRQQELDEAIRIGKRYYIVIKTNLVKCDIIYRNICNVRDGEIRCYSVTIQRGSNIDKESKFKILLQNTEYAFLLENSYRNNIQQLYKIIKASEVNKLENKPESASLKLDTRNLKIMDLNDQNNQRLKKDKLIRTISRHLNEECSEPYRSIEAMKDNWFIGLCNYITNMSTPLEIFYSQDFLSRIRGIDGESVIYRSADAIIETVDVSLALPSITYPKNCLTNLGIILNNLNSAVVDCETSEYITHINLLIIYHDSKILYTTCIANDESNIAFNPFYLNRFDYEDRWESKVPLGVTLQVGDILECGIIYNHSLDYGKVGGIKIPYHENYIPEQTSVKVRSIISIMRKSMASQLISLDAVYRPLGDNRGISSGTTSANTHLYDPHSGIVFLVKPINCPTGANYYKSCIKIIKKTPIVEMSKHKLRNLGAELFLSNANPLYEYSRCASKAIIHFIQGYYNKLQSNAINQPNNFAKSLIEVYKSNNKTISDTLLKSLYSNKFVELSGVSTIDDEDDRNFGTKYYYENNWYIQDFMKGIDFPRMLIGIEPNTINGIDKAKVVEENDPENKINNDDKYYLYMCRLNNEQLKSLLDIMAYTEWNKVYSVDSNPESFGSKYNDSKRIVIIQTYKYLWFCFGAIAICACIDLKTFNFLIIEVYEVSEKGFKFNVISIFNSLSQSLAFFESFQKILRELESRDDIVSLFGKHDKLSEEDRRIMHSIAYEGNACKCNMKFIRGIVDNTGIENNKVM